MKWRLGLLAAVFVALGVTDAWAQERTIRGTVTDDVSGDPISFAQISVDGTAIGTVGGEDGSFTLTGVPAGQVTLVVRRIGQKTRQVVVPADQNVVNITMERDYLQVDELVVTGRATAVRRRNLANAVETVSGDRLNEVPNETIQKALQGKVAGAVISQNSGAPGSGQQIQLRGTATINASSSPLYVVDGVIVSNASIPPNTNALLGSTSGSNPTQNQDNDQNRIGDLSPTDIESIEILKGASASAIYGSKASNGVVIITTKKGRGGASVLRLSGRGGFFDLSNKLGFRDFESEAAAVEAFGPDAAKFFEPGRTFDHEEELSGRNDFSFDVSGNLSGGDEDLSYFLSAVVKEDEGIMDNTGFARQSVRANVQKSVGRATINVNTNLLHTSAGRGFTNNDNNNVSAFMVLTATPNFIDLSQQSDGTWPVNEFIPNGSNPLQTHALATNDEDVWRLIASGNLDLSVFEADRHSFDVIVNGGVDFFAQENEILSPPELHFESDDGLLGTSLLSNSDNLNTNLNVNGVWEVRPSSGLRATTSAGFQYERRDLNIARVVGKGLTGGKPNVDAAVVVSISEDTEKVEDFGFYVQEEILALDDRLLLTASIRGDQTSANGDDDEVFFYPKAAASYRIPGVAFFEEVKLRTAFGQTGNQPLFGQEFTELEVDNNLEGIPGFVIEGTVGGADIQPERTTEIEGGVDLTLANGRGLIELTGYYQRITDLILNAETAPSTGFVDRFLNGGTLRNVGFEAGVGLTPITSADLTWISRTTFTLNRSEILELDVPAFEPDPGFGTGIGSPFVEEGKSATQIAASTPEGCCLTVGDSEPDFSVGFSNDLQAGQFRLFSLFDWRVGQDIVNLTQFLQDGASNSPDFVDQDGTIRDPLECGSFGGNECSGEERSAGVNAGFAGVVYTQPASFLKLREVSLSYELPAEARARLFGGAFDRVRLNVSARNVFTITPYEGLDPEVSNFGNQQIGRGIDVAPFPPSRSFWFGVDLTL